MAALAVCVNQADDLEFLLGLWRGRIFPIRGGGQVESLKKKPPTRVNGFGVCSVLLVQGFECLGLSLADEV